MATRSGLPSKQDLLQFVKENNLQLAHEEYNYTSPFIFLGEAEYVKHEGSKPMSFVWRLKEDMPPVLVTAANKAIG